MCIRDRLKLFRWERPVEIIALGATAAHFFERGGLFLGFHALRYASHAASLTDPHDILHQHLADGIAYHTRNQAAVQLDRIKLHTSENLHIGVFRTKIIQAKVRCV